MSEDLPDTALQLRSLVTGEGTVRLSLEEVDVPRPRPHQVVVRVEASPVNPSDLALLLAGADFAGAERSGTPDRPVLTAPLTPAAVRAAGARVGESMPVGNEGAGTVVAAGTDRAAQELLGTVVAVAGGAMYSQYRCVDAATCIALPEGTPVELGAAAFVNPMTVLGMIGTMRAEGHTALVHTAAASNLGQMLARQCRVEGVGLVNVVRSAAQVDLLRSIGSEHVCDSSTDGFMADLVAAVSATGATLAFDAIGGGSIASRILAAMETAASAGAEYSRYGSSVHKQVYIYGGLDRAPTTLTRSFGMAWGLGGWLLMPYLGSVGPEGVAAMRSTVVEGLTTTFASHYSDTVSLAGALDAAAVAGYAAQATGRKYLIAPTT